MLSSGPRGLEPSGQRSKVTVLPGTPETPKTVLTKTVYKSCEEILAATGLEGCTALAFETLSGLNLG